MSSCRSTITLNPLPKNPQSSVNSQENPLTAPNVLFVFVLHVIYWVFTEGIDHNCTPFCKSKDVENLYYYSRVFSFYRTRFLLLSFCLESFVVMVCLWGVHQRKLFTARAIRECITFIINDTEFVLHVASSQASTKAIHGQLKMHKEKTWNERNGGLYVMYSIYSVV